MEFTFKTCARICLAWHVCLISVMAEESALSLKAKSLLVQKCVSCHHGDDAKGQLDLTTRELLFKGGESGPAIQAKSAEESLIWQRVVQDEMPPKHPLSAEEKRLLKDWRFRRNIVRDWTGGLFSPCKQLEFPTAVPRRASRLIDLSRTNCSDNSSPCQRKQDLESSFGDSRLICWGFPLRLMRLIDSLRMIVPTLSSD